MVCFGVGTPHPAGAEIDLHAEALSNALLEDSNELASPVVHGLSLSNLGGSPPAVENDSLGALSAEDRKLFQLLERMAQVEKNDPCSQELKELSGKLDRTLKNVDFHKQSDPDANLSGLPGNAPSAGKARRDEAIRPPSPRSDRAIPPAPPMPVGTVAPVGTLTDPESSQPYTPSRLLDPGLPTIIPEQPAGRDNSFFEIVKKSPDSDQAASLAPPSPDDVVKINVKDNLLDINMLIETVGKELKFNFLYDTDKGITGRFKLQQFGDIRRRDLLPLLESVLGFKNLGMIRDDPYIRIVDRKVALKKTPLPISEGEELPDLAAGDMVVAQMIELKHIDAKSVAPMLANFVDEVVIVTIPNSNRIIITDYVRRMPRVLKIVRMIDVPGPPKRLEIMLVEHLKASDIHKTITSLMKAMQADRVSVPAGKGPTPAPKGRRTKGQAAATPAKVGSQAGAGDPYFLADDRTSRLFVIGTDDQIEEIGFLLNLLDVDIDVLEIDLESFQIKNVLVDDLVKPLSDLYKALTPDTAAAAAGATPATKSTETKRTPRTPRGATATGARIGKQGPFMLALESTNVLLVVGSYEQLLMIEDLIDVLDVEASGFGGVPRLEIYQPQFVEVAEARNIMDDLGITKKARSTPRDRARGAQPKTNQRLEGETGLPGAEEFEIRIALQEDLNKMLVIATELQHREIEKMLHHIDEEPNESAGAVQFYMLENREPEAVANMLTVLLEADQTGKDDKKIPGVEGAPIIDSLDDIYAVAVRGTQKQHKEIAAIIKVLDKRLPEVLVEAILVQVSGDDGLNLGISLQNAWQVDQTRSGRSRSVSASSPFGISAQANDDNTLVLGTGGVLAFFTDNQVYATLEALQQQGNTKVVSKPRILVNDNEQGIIDSKQQKPTTKTTIPVGSDTPIIEFNGYVDAGTKLTITPHISEGAFLTLDIDLNVNSFGDTVSENIPPEKFTNQLQTLVTVPDGMTIVLGGLTSQSSALTVKKVPLLGDIPLIGALFQNVSRSNNRSALYIFVRAHIVRSIGDHSDFSDLDALSQHYRVRLSQEEAQAKKQSVIPGLPADDKTRNDPAALNDWYDPNRPLVHQYGFDQYDDD